MKTISTFLPNASLQLGSRLHHFDGVNTNRTDDGNQVFRPMGIIAPFTSPSAAISGAGNVDEGVHGIYVTFVYVVNGAVLVESNPCPLATITVPGGGGTKSIALTAVPISPNPIVTGRKIYVTRAGGTIGLQVTTAVAEITDNTTTTYTYNTADASLSSVTLSTTGNTPIPCAAYATNFANRIISGGGVGKFTNLKFTNGSANFTYSGGDVLQIGDIGKSVLLSSTVAYTIATISETANTGTLTIAYQGTTSASQGDVCTIINEPNTITIGNALPLNVEGYDSAADSQFQVGQDDGMYLRAIAPYRSSVLFGKSRAIYQLVGDIITDPTNGPAYRIDLLSNKVGIAAHLSVSNMLGGGIIFYGGDGIYVLNGYEPIKVSELLNPLFNEQEESAINLGGEDCRVDHTYDSICHGVFDPVDQRYFLWLARKANSTTAIRKPCDLCIMLDFKRKNSKGQPAAWAFIMPAAISRGFQDESFNKFRIVIGTYHSKAHEVFIGYRDGVPNISTGSTNFLFKVSAVTAPSGSTGTLLTFSAVAPYGGYQDITGGSGGLPIVGVSGTRKGRFSVIKSYNTTNIVEVDEELWGTCPFAVNDIVTIGGYQALWTSNQDTQGTKGVLKRGSVIKTTFDIPVFTSVDT